VAHDVVEDVLLTVKKLPGRVDRTAIVAALERAVEGLQMLEASSLHSSDHLDKLDAARSCVRDGVDAIEGHDHSNQSLSMAKRLRGLDRILERAREATLDAVVSNQGAHLDAAFADRAREEVPPVEPFAASHGAPLLHTMERELVRAHVDVEPEDLIWDDYAEAPEEDENVEEDEDPDAALDLAATLPELEEEEDDFRESDPAKRLPLLVANSKATVATMMPGVEGEVAQIERLIRTCLEDIGVMGNLRRLHEHERYDLSGMTRFETRMCACIDAVIALGQPFFTVSAPGSCVSGVDVLDAAVRYAREAITADPGRAFARTMLLCSVAGEDTVRAAVLALKESPPYTFRAQGEALSIAPNPHVADAMHRLTTDDDSRVVSLALDVLSARGEAKFGTLTTLLEHPQEEVRVSAVRALGFVKEREAAEQILVDLCETEIDDDVWVAGVEALVRLGSPEGLALVRERMVEEVQEEDADMLRADLRTRCMRLLGVAGKPDDYLLLERLYFGDRGQAAALGFHGHVRLVDRLLLALEGADAGGGVYLGQAGKREAALALQRITAAPFVIAGDGHVDPYRVDPDFRLWIAWWEENRSRFDPDVRYRFGQPYSGLFSVHELLADNVPVTTRRECAFELEVLLGEPFPLHDFAANQREALERARASIEMAAASGDHRFAPGRWLTLR
jgi:HEAT repeat protein